MVKFMAEGLKEVMYIVDYRVWRLGGLFLVCSLQPHACATVRTCFDDPAIMNRRVYHSATTFAQKDGPREKQKRKKAKQSLEKVVRATPLPTSYPKPSTLVDCSKNGRSSLYDPYIT